MPRVTRAAARADHDLANEIDTVAEIAIAEDSTTVPLPESPMKSSDRKPLGETGGNAAAPAQIEQHTPTQDDRPQGSPGETIVINVGNQENAASAGTITKQDGPKSAKKSTRKGKGTATNTLRGQFNEQLGEWTQSMKDKTISPIKLDDKLASSSPAGSAKKRRNRKKKGTQKGGNAVQQTPEIFDDERQATRSPASDEAVELLKVDSASDNNIIEDDRPASATISPIAEAIAKLEQSPSEQEAVPTAAKLAVVKEPPPALFGEQRSSTPAAEVDGHEKPEAVQKLESLFQPAKEVSREEKTPSPLASVLAHTPSSKAASPKKNPIEALDALEDDIEAVKASLEMTTLPSTSPIKAKRTSPIKKTDSKIMAEAKPSKTKPVRPSYPPINVKASAVDRRMTRYPDRAKPSVAPKTKPQSKLTATGASETAATPSKPTAVERARQRAAIAALRTPPAVAKSSKPVTKATFQLPGEAAAAKLKALKEEREKRRDEAEKAAEDNKSKATTKAASKPATLRPSLAKASRPSITPKPEKSHDGSTMAPKRTSTAAPRPSTVRPARPSPLGSSSTTATTKGPRSSIVPSKAAVPRVARMSTAASVAEASSASPEIDSKKVTATATRTARPSAASTQKRPSMLNTANSSRQRVSSTEASTSGSDNKAASGKGKEVFNREKVAKQANEKAIKERIEAAKKAREEATMRGKAAARAWAEKREKKAGAGKSAIEPSKELKETLGVQKENAEPVEGVVLAAPVVDGNA